jgi:hypothetical protein
MVSSYEGWGQAQTEARLAIRLTWPDQENRQATVPPLRDNGEMETDPAKRLARHWAERSALRAAAEDTGAMAARRDHCRLLVTHFGRLGEWLRCFGNIIGPQGVEGNSPFGNGDDGVVALGYLSETAASLISGASDLIVADNPYAAAALVRQLVEVEYLAWAFAEEQEEAASWLRSSREERRQRWQPRHLRERSNGRFRGADYADHCDVGGHPTPQGVRLYSDGPGTLPRNRELIVSEIAHHGTSAWHYEHAAYLVLDVNEEAFIRELNTVVISSEQAWRDLDHLAPTWLDLQGPDANPDPS